MKIFSSKRRVAAAAAVVLLALFLIRPGASRLKSRIITSLSAAMGRSVDIGSVHIHLLPRPGFDLESLVVYDDPEFGAEPMLRASEVSAELRLTSLLRGRLEVARLSLTEPSLNLVHSESGRWNLEALLERAAHAPTAPTGKSKSEPRPGFPYIEGTSARINFKSGFEKIPYALTNADFSLWQDSENTWGVRLKAQPFRGDMNLNDTGLLQVNGTWQRAETFRDTPLQFDVEWSRAQLGQVTKFFTGNDKGWRGGIRFDANFSGSPAKLKIVSAASVEDFRRYDIASGSALRLSGRCEAEYSSLTHEFDDLQCRAPIGTGLLTVAGTVGLAESRHYALSLTADKVPANALAMLAQRVKKDVPGDLVVDGALQGKILLQEDLATGAKPRFEGRGEIAGLHMSSAETDVEFGPQTIPFAFVGSSVPGRRRESGMQAPEGNHLEFGPVTLGGSRVESASIRGWANRAAYGANLTGSADVGRILRLARLVGIPALAANTEGSAQLNLQIGGSWVSQSATGAGFVGPQVTGSARLQNVRVPVRGAGIVEIGSAEMQFAPDGVHVGKLAAKAAGTNWTGWLQLPRGCATPGKCPAQFSLTADDLSLTRMTEWAVPSSATRPWYRVLDSGSQNGPSALSRIVASGHVAAGRLAIHAVSANRVSANVSLDAGKLQITSLDADFLGGKHHGKWAADFSVKPAACSGSGTLAGISLVNLAEVMKDPWIAGSGNGSYDVSGPCTADFWQVADGRFKVDLSDAVLPHVLMREDSGPLRVSRLSGEGRLRTGKIEISNTQMGSTDGTYEITGTATLKRELDVKVTRIPGGATPTGYMIGGTLTAPRVAPLGPTEQARLKTAAAK